MVKTIVIIEGPAGMGRVSYWTADGSSTGGGARPMENVVLGLVDPYSMAIVALRRIADFKDCDLEEAFEAVLRKAGTNEAETENDRP